ncbi:MAG: nucleotidyltransferase domain-containing protein [Candidatus Nanoarchaeia archaeon]
MKLISFAYDFVSYLLQHLEKPQIKRIILFGSVVREEADKNSDIDLFIETNLPLQESVNKVVDNFYASTKYKNYWKLLNVKNQLKPLVGKLEDFPDLKRSMISNSLLLYSPFQELLKGKNYSIFTVSFTGPFKKKMSLWRKLYGYNQLQNKKEYHHPGLIETYGGRKLAKGIFLIPIEHSNAVMKELRLLKIKYQVFDASSDTL